MAVGTSSYAPLDEALDRLAPYGPELTNGNFNHAPMVTEALCALGRPEAVLPWIERYRPRLVPRRSDEGEEPIVAERWRAELGRRDRFVAWSRFFAGALDREGSWPDVLDVWAARLAPGVSAAATHGPIRVGHAVRSLTVAGETAPRRRELGDALASWASTYSELPASDGVTAAMAPPRAALARVAVVPPEQRRPGNIAAALARLDQFPEFAPVIDLAELDGDLDHRLAELCELFARVYLANVSNIPTAIVFIHGVTSLAALGHIAQQVGEATARSLLRYGWQAGCGLYACFGGAGLAEEVVPGDVAGDALIDRALAIGDEHAIKFTEACLARDRRAPSPAYRAAAANALAVLGAPR